MVRTACDLELNPRPLHELRKTDTFEKLRVEVVEMTAEPTDPADFLPREELQYDAQHFLPPGSTLANHRPDQL
jgi:hypothetical protein